MEAVVLLGRAIVVNCIIIGVIVVFTLVAGIFLAIAGVILIIAAVPYIWHCLWVSR